MVFNYSIIFIVIAIAVLYSMWSCSLEAKVKNIPRRDKKIAEAEAQGYKVSKRWDCNGITIFADEKQKVLLQFDPSKKGHTDSQVKCRL